MFGSWFERAVFSVVVAIALFAVVFAVDVGIDVWRLRKLRPVDQLPTEQLEIAPGMLTYARIVGPDVQVRDDDGYITCVFREERLLESGWESTPHVVRGECPKEVMDRWVREKVEYRVSRGLPKDTP